jgi:phytoene dehydrogenase-like protein
MIAALKLAERGYSVSIFEMSERLGGKAGAIKHGADFDEHGYHIFPAWYYNANKLAEELRITKNFINCEDFFQLAVGSFPHFKNFKNITSWRYLWTNLRAGVLPFFEAFLFYYAALDLMSQPYSYRAQLDQVTITGFLRSRFYRTDHVASQFQELMLKGISVPTYEVSAMTMRNVMRYWVRSPEPMHRILIGNLETFWIDPIANRLKELGCTFHHNRKLKRIEVENGRIARLHFQDDQNNETTHDVDAETRVVLAIPVEKLVPLINDDLHVLDANLSLLRYLRTRTMAALNVYFKHVIPYMPRAHVNLIDSKFGLSFIDVSQTWAGYKATVLNLIASDFTALEGLSPQAAIDQLMTDFFRYFPGVSRDDILKVDFQSHTSEPLFMNNVGGWAFRPTASTQVPNLYLAGDFCRSHIDLVSMEGAITTGLLAAQAICEKDSHPQAVEVLVPPAYPEWLLRVGKIAILPLVIFAYVAARLQGHPAEK